MSNLPPAPPEEESRDGCCPQCGSLFHSTHPKGASLTSTNLASEDEELPEGYDPSEADRLIGREGSMSLETWLGLSR